MHIKFFTPAILVPAALLLGVPLFAQNNHAGPQGAKPEASAEVGKLFPVTEKDAGWAGKARKSYPLEVCVTSDEKLGSMGKSPEYIHRVDGKPDRLVVFCCAGCEEDFLKEPAKYIAKLDAAATKTQSAAKKSADTKR